MSAPALRVAGLHAGYRGLTVVRGVSFDVDAGAVCVIVGQNGAGKTTTLRAIAGMLRATAGRVECCGADVTDASTHRRLAGGLGFVPEGRALATQLTAEDNLRLATRSAADRRSALELFPELEVLLGRRAGLLSGGEQQMLSIARAVATRPRVLLIDEMSLGLAPVVVERLVDSVRTLAAAGTAVVVVEQHVRVARLLADHVVVLRRGEQIYAGAPAALDDADGALGFEVEGAPDRSSHRPTEEPCP
jgi:ABC-type branched-subunit amino acid transport system ATPase component